MPLSNDRVRPCPHRVRDTVPRVGVVTVSCVPVFRRDTVTDALGGMNTTSKQLDRVPTETPPPWLHDCATEVDVPL